MRLHVHEWGPSDAPPIVCLHGLNAHGRRFRRLAEERLQLYHVLAPDLRGHGRSSWDPPWRLSTYVSDVLETLDGHGVPAATFVGHSLGGRLILEMAATAPERLERVVLMDPAIQVTPEIALKRTEAYRRDRRYASVEEAIARLRDRDPGNPLWALEEDAQDHLARGGDGCLRPRFSNVCVIALYSELTTEPPPPDTLRVPTLLIYSPLFGLVREDQIRHYAAEIGQRFEILSVPGGHIVYWDAWEETAAAVDAFLALTPARS